MRPLVAVASSTPFTVTLPFSRRYTVRVVCALPPSMLWMSVMSMMPAMPRPVPLASLPVSSLLMTTARPVGLFTRIWP